MIMLRADQGMSDLVENRVPDLPVGCVKAIEAGESNDLEAENADSRLLGGILELKAPSRESVPTHQPLSSRRNIGQSPAIVAIRIRSGSSQQTIRNVVASVLRGDQGALGPETREDALDPALTVRDQDLVIRAELGFELVSPQSHSLSTFGFVLSEEVPWHSVLAAVSSHDIGFLRSLAGDVPADPATPVPELHGIMNAELRGARHCPNSRNHLACPVRKPNHHSGRRTGVPLRAGTMSRISFDRLRPTAPVASPIPGRSGGGAYHSYASAGSDLQNRNRLPRLVAESELLVTGLRQNNHQQPAPDVFLSNRDPSTGFRTNRPSADQLSLQDCNLPRQGMRRRATCRILPATRFREIVFDEGRIKTARKMASRQTYGGATTGYEAELWAMTDALRGSMDAAEYKHKEETTS